MRRSAALPRVSAMKCKSEPLTVYARRRCCPRKPAPNTALSFGVMPSSSIARVH